MDVVIALSGRGLAFTGKNAHIGDVHNVHFPYWDMIELISRYDSLLQENMNKIKVSQSFQNRLQVHYLSPDTENEFIALCGDEVTRKILQKETLFCDS